MELKDLHAEYGRLIIQQKIINGKLAEVEKAIVEQMNKKDVELKDVPQK